VSANASASGVRSKNPQASVVSSPSDAKVLAESTIRITASTQPMATRGFRMRLAEVDDTSNRPRNDAFRPRQPLEPRFQGYSVDEVWLLVKCSCGNWFGARKTAIATCPRCGSSDSCKPLREFHSPEQLSEAVASSNLPRQISQEVETRIAVEESSRSTVTEKQRGGPEAIKIIMKQSTGDDGTLSMRSLSRELEKEGIDEPSVEQIIGQAELEGILIRTSPDSWSWL